MAFVTLRSGIVGDEATVKELRDHVAKFIADRQAGQPSTSAGSAEDPVGQDHAPAEPPPASACHTPILFVTTRAADVSIVVVSLVAIPVVLLTLGRG